MLNRVIDLGRDGGDDGWYRYWSPKCRRVLSSDGTGKGYPKGVFVGVGKGTQWTLESYWVLNFPIVDRDIPGSRVSRLAITDPDVQQSRVGTRNVLTL